jgi:hypothetical protein
MKFLNICSRVVSSFLILSFSILPAAPAFAQLGGVTPPPVPPVVIPLPPADTTPPVISGIASLSLGIFDATIAWTTDELAVSTFQYGTTTSYGSSASISVSALLAHTAVLTGLAANTTYYYCIHATDLAGNSSSSCGHSLTTAAAPILVDATPPNISLITVVSATSTASISFTTDEVANSEVEYGLTAGYGSASSLDTDLSLGHTVALSGLAPDTEYHYRIRTADQVGNTAFSPDEVFTMAALPVVIVAPPADTTPPVISGVGQLSLGITDSTIVWETNELAVSTLEYGTTTSYGSQAMLPLSALLAHTATLTGLSSGTTYYYCIHATDLAGNSSSSCAHTFTTEAAPVSPALSDTTPPALSLIIAAPVIASDATISWSVSELADGQVEYGATADYGLASNLDSDFSLDHSITLSGLMPDTTYHFRVKSADQSGNLAASFDMTFTTEGLPPAEEIEGGTEEMTGPLPETTSTLNFSAIEASSISGSAAAVNWQTSLPSDSQVEYGDSEALGLATSVSSDLVTSHSIILPNLSADTNYIFRVKSRPLGAPAAFVSENYEFNTLSAAVPVIIPANITLISSSGVSSSEATVSWETDKPASTQVEYGLSTEYGQASVLDSALASSHSVSLSNLEPETLYHFRARSEDADGNVTFSEDYTFMTSAPATAPTPPGGSSGPSAPVVLPAPAAVALSIGAYDEDSVELAWNVSSADSDAAAQYDIRYSASPINGSNFENAAEAQSAPIPFEDLSPSGTSRRYIISGLTKGTTYYFAAKSKFEESPYSDISNIVSASTTEGASVDNEAPRQGNSQNENVPQGNQGSQESGHGVFNASAAAGGGSEISYGGNAAGSSPSSFEPTVVKGEGADGEIVFSWNNPGEANFVRTVIVKKDGSYPSSPSDGKVIYEGRGTTFSDTSLENGKTQYYALYSYNHDRIYSPAVRLSLAAVAGKKEVVFNESGFIESAVPVFHFTKVLQKGNKDIEIEHLQEILSAENSYPEKYITGYFGSLTESALKIFQAKRSLPATGAVDAATQKELNLASQSETKLEIPSDYALLDTDLKLGAQGEAVKDLQIFLTYEGSYAEAIISGYFGKYTKTAVQKFQKKYGVTPVSGLVSYKTRHKMRQLVGL